MPDLLFILFGSGGIAYVELSSALPVWPNPNQSIRSKVTRKKLPNVYKKLPKNDFTRKMIDFQKLPKNVGDLGKFIVAKGFKKLAKVQKIARSGHTDQEVSGTIVLPPKISVLCLKS